jgi:A/G-specific adenine glycosylase
MDIALSNALLNFSNSSGFSKRRFRSNLLAWYDVHRRDLPWRKTRDPYRIWLSEVMLQQTRVAAVMERYHEFLRKFPTIEKLARARESSVLAAWSGLGYYRRARLLHAAAKIVVSRCGAKIPASFTELQSLPSIGRYTAAAIASIAFGEAVAVVDGNVERVLQRVTGKNADVDLWRAAEQVLDRKRPGDFNQAMMELGATVCTPRRPACLTCPIRDLCATRGELTSDSKPASQTKREIHYALHHRDQAVFLVRRRRDASLMPGMWELPERVASISEAKPAFTLRHSITVTNYTVRVWRQALPDDAPGEWIALRRLPVLPLTGLAGKILRQAGLLAGLPSTAATRPPEHVTTLGFERVK